MRRPFVPVALTFASIVGCGEVSTSPDAVAPDSPRPDSAGPTFPVSVTKAGTGAGLVLSQPAGIDCGATCSASFAEGSTVVLTANPSAGSSFAGWTGGGCSGTDPCTVTVSAATAVAAKFTLNNYALTVTRGGNGFGTVAAGLPGLACGTDCTESYPFNTTVTLTASAGAASTFMGWSGGGCTGTSTCDVTITEATDVAAMFTATQLWPDSLTQFCTSGTAPTTCPGVPGQDGAYARNVPTYTVGTGTVTDPQTGLIWQQTPPYLGVSYATAATYCGNLILDGASDWRLPTLIELASLVDAGRVAPAFPTTEFPGIPQNAFFWTSSAATDPGIHHTIGTNYAVTDFQMDTAVTGMLARCVRGPALTNSLVAEAGTIVDAGTNLFWQSDTAPTPLTWQDALAYCEALELDGIATWRLPTVKELMSIIDTSRTDPAIAPEFASRPLAVFWSSTPVPNLSGTGYAIDFGRGRSFGIERPFGNAFTVRCVH